MKWKVTKICVGEHKMALCREFASEEFMEPSEDRLCDDIIRSSLARPLSWREILK